MAMRWLRSSSPSRSRILKALPPCPSFDKRVNVDSAPIIPKTGFPILVLFLGLGFIVLWLSGAFFFGTLKLMATVMANDAGVANSQSHLSLIGGVVAGQVLTALAGIPAGLAFFWRTARRKLLWTFAILLAAGLLLQVASFLSFVP